MELVRENSSPCKVKVMIRRGGQKDCRVSFNVYSEGGHDFTGSIVYKNSPRLSRVVQFLDRELRLGSGQDASIANV